MSTNRRIVLADLDESSRSLIAECLPPDHFELTVFKEGEGPNPPGQVDLIIFRARKEVDQNREFCALPRSQVSQGAPLLACVNQYAYAVVRPLLNEVVQGALLQPFSTASLRAKLDEMDLGF